jgi:hypothetical protein
VPGTIAETGPNDHRRRVARAEARRRRRKYALLVVAACSLAAMFAPAALTGTAAVDIVERVALTGVVAWLAGHGRRAALLWAGAAVAIVSRDLALALALLALGLAVWNASLGRRNKVIGVAAAGLLANAVLWIPAAPPWRWATGAAFVVLAVVAFAGRRQIAGRDRRVIGRGLLAFVGLALVSTSIAGFASLAVARRTSHGSQQARQALEAVRAGDTDRARTLLAEAENELASAQGTLRLASIARATPLVAQQVEALQVAVGQARAVTGAAGAIVATNYDDLRYQGRVDLEEVERLTPLTERADAVLTEADRQLRRVDRAVVVGPIRSRLAQFRTSVDEARNDASSAGSILTRLPGLLGGDGERHYLVVFTAPAELRGGGGFIGSWLDLQVLDGKATIARSGRIRDLIDYSKTSVRPVDAPADYVRRYGRYTPQYLLQDATLSPNWPSTARLLAGVYPAAGGVPVDGVIAVDPAGLGALLALTGPVTVEGLDAPLTSQNVTDVLNRTQYLTLGDRAAREDVLADATRATFDALTNASLPAPRLLGAVLGPAARGRHLQVWLTRSVEERFVRDLGVDATLEVPKGGDGFEVVQQNVGNNKIDAYLHRKIAYDVTLDPADGTISGTLTVTLRNEVPSVDLPPIVVGNERGLPVGSNVATISLHAPLVVTAATLDGKTFEMGRSEEAGMFAWDSPVVTIPPGGVRVVELQVEGAVDLQHGYRLRVLPQPVVHADAVSVRVRLKSGTFAPLTTERGDVSVRTDGQDLEATGDLTEVLDVDVPVRR